MMFHPNRFDDRGEVIARHVFDYYSKRAHSIAMIAVKTLKLNDV